MVAPTFWFSLNCMCISCPFLRDLGCVTGALFWSRITAYPRFRTFSKDRISSFSLVLFRACFLLSVVCFIDVFSCSDQRCSVVSFDFVSINLFGLDRWVACLFRRSLFRVR